jgi:hypothetical protein
MFNKQNNSLKCKNKVEEKMLIRVKNDNKKYKTWWPAHLLNVDHNSMGKENDNLLPLILQSLLGNKTSTPQEK